MIEWVLNDDVIAKYWGIFLTIGTL